MRYSPNKLFDLLKNPDSSLTTLPDKELIAFLNGSTRHKDNDNETDEEQYKRGMALLVTYVALRGRYTGTKECMLDNGDYTTPIFYLPERQTPEQQTVFNELLTHRERYNQLTEILYCRPITALITKYNSSTPFSREDEQQLRTAVHALRQYYMPMTQIRKSDNTVVREEAPDTPDNVYNLLREATTILKASKEAIINTNRIIGATITPVGACIMLTSIVFAANLSSMIAANPVAGGCILATVLFIGAALSALGSVYGHASRKGMTVTELLRGQQQEEDPDSDLQAN